VKRVVTDTGEALVLGLIHTEGDGRLLAREPLTLNDLLLARDETWLAGLSAGVLGPDLSSLSLRVLPGENAGADRLLGYSIELGDNSRSFRRRFSIYSLAPVARRAARALLKQQEQAKEPSATAEEETDPFAENGEFSYFLTAVPAEHEEPPQEPGEGMRVTRRSEPLVFEPAALGEFLQKSELLTGSSAVEEKQAEESLPVFVSREVWDEGHELARAGGEKESAAVWTGRLLRDTQSPRIFVVLDACIKAEHAAEEKYKVTFSGDTWARVRELLDLRRRRLGRPNERILGSVHGHNFLPSADEHGRRMCRDCLAAQVCSRTTAAASADDLDWHRAVFIGQPWALLLVWGHNAREQEDWRLYGLANATLTPRTIRLLKE
jgi:hypothetical protein